LAEVKRICFVCLGNIIRSPLAKGLFLQMAREAGVTDRYEVDSAGIDSWHAGEPPDSRMRRVAARHGLIYDGRARQIRVEDLDHFDLLVAMDLDNRRDLLALARSPQQRAKIRLLREFDPEGGPNVPVPDPYYGGRDGFEEVFGVVERSTRGLFETLEGG
jgi:protein-tyrosine phosphatase